MRYFCTSCKRAETIWQAEHALNDQGLEPQQALRRLVEFRVDYCIANPTFVALVSIENQHEARHLKRARSVMASAAPPGQNTTRSEGAPWHCRRALVISSRPVLSMARQCVAENDTTRS